MPSICLIGFVIAVPVINPMITVIIIAVTAPPAICFDRAADWAFNSLFGAVRIYFIPFCKVL